jgi:hypothetical protein
VVTTLGRTKTENGIVKTAEIPTRADVPQIERVPATMLNIAAYDPGPGYQRPADLNRVARIAREWDWALFDPLTVSRRRGGPRDGELFVVDGQHGWLAAMERWGETIELPATMLHLTLEEEAERFARQHENARRPIQNHRFAANITARDEETLAIKAIVERQGWIVSPYYGPQRHNAISAAGNLVTAYRAYGPDVLELTLKVLAEAYTYKPASVDGRLIRGLAHFLYHFPVANIGELTERLMRPEALPARLYQNSAMYSSNTGGTSGAISHAIFDQYNRRRSGSTKLTWDLKKYRTTEAAAKRNKKGGISNV